MSTLPNVPTENAYGLKTGTESNKRLTDLYKFEETPIESDKYELNCEKKVLENRTKYDIMMIKKYNPDF